MKAKGTRRPGAPAPAPAAGVVGLGLMGHSIIACLLAAGHRVIGVTRDLGRHRDAAGHIRELLAEMRRERLLRRDPAKAAANLLLTEDYRELAPCQLVVESIIEDIETKREAYRSIEDILPPDAIIGTNTSSIPVSILQRGARHPGRFVGIHWMNPRMSLGSSKSSPGRRLTQPTRSA
jgi:3-hydroxybutyryl-CoA dehydrogenase